MSNQKLSITKPVVSISELCERLQLSRSRFYQLVNNGFFPPPIYDLKSKRPYFDTTLQQQCLEARQTGIGSNGSILLFYPPRKTEIRARKKIQKIDTQIQEYADTLNNMGLNVSAKQVKVAIAEVFQEGSNGQDTGLVVRELFRHFKQKM